MRKIMVFMFSVNVIVFFLLNLSTFSMDIENRIFSEKRSIIIEMDSDLTTIEHVSLLEDFFEKKGMDILFLANDFSTGDHDKKLMFSTANTTTFLPMVLEGGSYDPSYIYKTEPLIDEENERRIFSFPLLQSYEIRPFLETAQYTLTSAVFYINSNGADALMQDMQNEGFNVSSGPIAIANSGDTVRTQIILFCFFVLSLLFYTFSMSKEVVVKKLGGYSFVDYVADVFSRDIKLLLYILFFGFLISGIFITLASHFMTAIIFFRYLTAQFIFAIFVSAIALLTSLFYIYAYSGHEQFKGRSSNLQLMALSLLSKALVLVLIGLHAVMLVNDVVSLSHKYRTLREHAERITGLATISPNVSIVGAEYMFANLDEYNENATALYLETVPVLNPILVWSNEYTGTAEEFAPTFTFDARILVVNDQYLVENPIYSKTGDRIYANDTDSKKLLFLLPDDETIDQKITMYSKWYDVSPDDIEVVLLSEDSTFFTYGSEVISDDGLLRLPNVMLYNPNIDIHKELAGMSDVLFFHSDSADYYNQTLLPYLEKHDLDSIFLEAPLLSTVISQSISHTKTNLTMVSIALVLYIIMLIAISAYAASVYCASFQKDIAVKRIHGYTFTEIHKKFILTTLLTYLICFGVLLSQGTPVGIILGVGLTDFLILLLMIRLYEKKSIHSIIKGG
ncbi:MAG TPA: DUF1430 domain-containing protein [Clostridiaceae bacterium]|nr:DUF1430 domain-containing protein [Clostridiaceae bacterium]